MSVETEWIRQKIGDLRAHADELKNVADEVDDPEYGAWTALKLMIFSAAVQVYTNVANSHGFDYYYVDAMAGAGVVNIRESDVALAGSAIRAGTVPKYPFEKMFLIESDTERAAALEKRLTYATEEIDAFRLTCDEWQVIDGNANEELPIIKDAVEEFRGAPPAVEVGGTRGHHFGFIDNERTEVKMAALEGLLDGFFGDHLINYQEVGINRRTGKIRKEELDDDWSDLVSFFGTEAVKEADTADERAELYKGQIETRLEQGRQRDALVQASDEYPFAYRTIYTAGGTAKHIQFMENFSEKVETLTGEDIAHVIDTMEGDGTALDFFLDDGPSQAGLDDF